MGLQNVLGYTASRSDFLAFIKSVTHIVQYTRKGTETNKSIGKKKNQNGNYSQNGNCYFPCTLAMIIPCPRFKRTTKIKVLAATSQGTALLYRMLPITAFCCWNGGRSREGWRSPCSAVPDSSQKARLFPEWRSFLNREILVSGSAMLQAIKLNSIKTLSSKPLPASHQSERMDVRRANWLLKVKSARFPMHSP